ncbi:hypothetical protein [Undibacterium flavidum]|uniref:Uncharacterized protein n=1 Tax=Undibacterium flavidum TaxID=2762297 RepID=A0ABR6YHG3_9BURK|nr:hypothetical protein [Undibacterium flavidum]MBC3875978.1 hypothetical protein [Undibacterium flavidum]
MEIGFSRTIETADRVTLTHPHPSPPLEREGTFSDIPIYMNTYGTGVGGGDPVTLSLNETTTLGSRLRGNDCMEPVWHNFDYFR